MRSRNVPYRRRAMIAVAGVVPIPPADGIAGTAGWQPAGTGQHASEQIGAYRGTLLNQFPAMIPGVQRRQGVEGLSSAWYTPTATVVPAGANGAPLFRTQHGANNPGWQLRGMAAGNPSAQGPIAVQSMYANVTAQQVRQSGKAATGWARNLSPAFLFGRTRSADAAPDSVS